MTTNISPEIIEALSIIDEIIVIIHKDLSISVSNWQSCDKLFNCTSKNTSFSRLEESLPSNIYSALTLGFQQYFDNILPTEMCLSMLPNQITLKSNKYVEIKYKPVLNTKDEPNTLILLLSDISDKKEADQGREAEMNRLKSLVQIIEQKTIFISFLRETSKLLASLKSSKDYTESKRILHTIKGNTASFSLVELSSSVHKFEQEIVGKMNEVTERNPEYVEKISTYLTTFIDANKELLGINIEATESGELVILTQNRHQEGTDNTIHAEGSLQAISLQYKSTIEKLAQRLNKKIHFITTGMDIGHKKEKVLPIVNHLIHVIRNCCDHGIEKTEERINAGKNEQGTIELNFSNNDTNDFIVEIKDDGQGINSEALLRKAIKNGTLDEDKAKKLTKEEIYSLIFVDGLSTSENVTSISGRGVGLSALKSEVESAGGKITVFSTPGKGSIFLITIPNAGSQATVTAKIINSNISSPSMPKSTSAIKQAEKKPEKTSHLFLPWNSSFSVGYEIIDNEHKKLVDILNKVASLQGDDNKIGEIHEVLGELASYTQKHFSTEQELMKKYDYPGAKIHGEHHRDLLKGVEKYIERLDKDKTQGLTDEILNFLKAWLLAHIVSEDMKLGKYLADIDNIESLPTPKPTSAPKKVEKKQEKPSQLFLPWNSNFSVGYEIIDNEHKKLVDILNKVASLQGDDNKIGQIHEVLGELASYTQKHFSTEQELMKKYDYPGAKIHGEHHRDLLQGVEKYIERLDKDKTQGLTNEILNFLKAWLLAHIVSEDMKLGKYLASTDNIERLVS